MHEDEVQTVQNWSCKQTTKNRILNTLFEVQWFLGFCDYYRRFIPKYSQNAERVKRLLKNGEPFVWESEPSLALETTITAVMTTLALHHFLNPTEVITERDDPDYVSAEAWL
jgi:hypothetical protein